MRFFYRVMNENLEGPYTGLVSNLWVEMNHDGCSSHPSPYVDKILGPKWERMRYQQARALIFGFSSKKQLKNWFSAQELQKLSTFGFSVYKIPADQFETVIVGDKQAVADRDSLKRLKKKLKDFIQAA